MSDGFVSDHEYEAVVQDALDKLRTETARQLRKFARRIKKDGERRVRELFAADLNADPEMVADAALHYASKGMFPRRVVELDAGTPADSE